MTLNTLHERRVGLLVSPWASAFYDLVGTAQNNLFITSPYIGGEPLKRLAGIISAKPSLQLHIITNLEINSLLTGSLDIASLTTLVEIIPNSKVTYLPSLHAKVYIADEKLAVITSGNLLTVVCLATENMACCYVTLMMLPKSKVI